MFLSARTDPYPWARWKKQNGKPLVKTLHHGGQQLHREPLNRSFLEIHILNELFDTSYADINLDMVWVLQAISLHPLTGRLGFRDFKCPCRCRLTLSPWDTKEMQLIWNVRLFWSLKRKSNINHPPPDPLLFAPSIYFGSQLDLWSVLLLRVQKSLDQIIYPEITVCFRNGSSKHNLLTLKSAVKYPHFRRLTYVVDWIPFTVFALFWTHVTRQLHSVFAVQHSKVKSNLHK